MTISKDRVKPSPMPDSWKLSEIFATGIVIGSYLALMTVIFFFMAYETNFFPVSNRLLSSWLYYKSDRAWQKHDNILFLSPIFVETFWGQELQQAPQ